LGVPLVVPGQVFRPRIPHRAPSGGTVDVTAAWINGGSPTTEFLRSETNGRLGEALAGLAGQTWVDWLFMIGVAGIGLALLLGIGVRIAAAGGAVLLLMIWATTLQPADNPLMDHRLIYAILLTGLGMMNIGNVLGLGTIWSHTGLVHKYPFLR
jgi:thiosulfate dehydrogenase [quinone] large subunit